MVDLIETPGKTEYTAILGEGDGVADASILVGGKDIATLLPNLNSSKWGDECFLNINPKWFQVLPSTIAKFDKGVVSLQNGDIKWLCYVDEKGHLEKRFAFSSKPSGDEIALELLHSSGLDFFYQGELAGDELEMLVNVDGELEQAATRPDNVVGSYAVYFNKAGNKYKTGKFCHIYAPYFIDNNEDSVKLDMVIDSGQLVISWAKVKAWLAKAAYPIILDPNLGYDTIGGSSAFVSYGANYANHDTSDGSGGETSEIYCHQAHTTGSHCTLAIYTDDAGNDRPEAWLATSVVLVGAAESWDSVAYVATLSASTKYWIGNSNYNSNTRISYDTDVANREHIYNNSETLQATWPDSGSNSSRRWSMYAVYASAAGLSIPIAMHHYTKNLQQ